MVIGFQGPKRQKGYELLGFEQFFSIFFSRNPKNVKQTSMQKYEVATLWRSIYFFQFQK